MLYIGKAEGFYNGYADTLHFTSMFMVGMLLFKYQEKLIYSYRNMKKFKRISYCIRDYSVFIFHFNLWFSRNDTTFLLKDWGVVMGLVYLL